MKSQYRLKENRDFRRVFNRGRSSATSRLVMYWYENRSTADFRVGFSISKKVGNSVVRNKLKRRLRECMMRFVTELTGSGADLVFVCRKSAADASFDELLEDVSKLLRKANFVV